MGVKLKATAWFDPLSLALSLVGEGMVGMGWDGLGWSYFGVAIDFVIKH